MFFRSARTLHRDINPFLPATVFPITSTPPSYILLKIGAKVWHVLVSLLALLNFAEITRKRADDSETTLTSFMSVLKYSHQVRMCCCCCFSAFTMLCRDTIARKATECLKKRFRYSHVCFQSLSSNDEWLPCAYNVRFQRLEVWHRCWLLALLFQNSVRKFKPSGPCIKISLATMSCSPLKTSFQISNVLLLLFHNLSAQFTPRQINVLIWPSHYHICLCPKVQTLRWMFCSLSLFFFFFFFQNLLA